MSTNEGHEQDIGIETNGITVHPKYDPSKTGYDNDIAIIKLKRSVQYTQRIKPVCINTGIDFTGKHSYSNQRQAKVVWESRLFTIFIFRWLTCREWV